MRLISIYIYLSLLSTISYGQGTNTDSVDSLLNKISNQLNTVKSGTLYLDYKFKSLLKSDTINYKVSIIFERQSSLKNDYVLYTPDVIYSSIDTTLLKFDVKKNTYTIDNYSCRTFDHDSKHLYSFYLNGVEDIFALSKDSSIVFNHKQKRDTTLFRSKLLKSRNDSNIKNIEQNFYFNSKLFPVKYESYASVFGFIQYIEISVDSIQLNFVTDTSFSINKINKKLMTTYSFIDTSFLKYTSVSKINSQLNVNEVAPDWSAHDINFDDVKLQEQTDSLYILDFWYVGCYPCLLSIPALANLNNRYAKKGLKIYGINPRDKDTSLIKRIGSIRGINYTILLDSGGIIADKYLVKSYPTLFVLDKNKTIKLVLYGYSENLELKLEQSIQELLKL